MSQIFKAFTINLESNNTVHFQEVIDILKNKKKKKSQWNNKINKFQDKIFINNSGLQMQK
jgi:hypothetical protein